MRLHPTRDPGALTPLGWLWAAACLLAAGAVLGAMLVQCAECKDRGGAFVKGVLWYECVEAKP